MTAGLVRFGRRSAPVGAGEAPLEPGTGNALAFGNSSRCESAFGAALAGGAPFVPGTGNALAFGNPSRCVATFGVVIGGAPFVPAAGSALALGNSSL